MFLKPLQPYAVYILKKDQLLWLKALNPHYQYIHAHDHVYKLLTVTI